MFASIGKSFAKSLKGNIDKGSRDEWDDPQKIHDEDSRWRAAEKDGDRRYDASVKLARDRGRVAIGALAFAACLGAGWWNQSQQSSVTTVFIPFNQIGEPGEVFVAKANEPPELMKIKMAETYVNQMFARSSDDVVNGDYESARIGFLRGRAADEWEAWNKKQDDHVTERRVMIRSSKQKSPNTFNVVWDEIDWSNGSPAGNRTRDCDFTIMFVPPSQAWQIVQNKTGLFLTHWVEGVSNEVMWQPNVNDYGYERK